MADAEPMQTDGPPPAPAPAAKQPLKGDRVTDGRDAPWVEKYRPKSLDDVAAHKEIIDTSACCCCCCWIAAAAAVVLACVRSCRLLLPHATFAAAACNTFAR